MNVTSVNSTTASRKGKAIGTAAGGGIGAAYIFKNRKDIFEKSIKSALNQIEAAGKDISKNKAMAVAGAVCAVTVGAAALAGRAIGGVIGKVVDKHNAKKQEKFMKTSNFGNIQLCKAVECVARNDSDSAGRKVSGRKVL